MTLRPQTTRVLVFCVAQVLVFSSLGSLSNPCEAVTIVYDQAGGFAERLAAKELRRYWYLRTGELAPVVKGGFESSGIDDAIIVGSNDSTVIREFLKKLKKN